MSQEIKYQKTFSLNVDNEKTEPPSKEKIIKEIKDIPAVSVRGHLDHLIEMDTDSEEPKLKWKDEALNVIDGYSLLYLLTFIRKRHEFELKRGVIDKPIMKHTYS